MDPCGQHRLLYFWTLLTGTSEALFFEYLKSIGKESDHLKHWGEGKSFSRLFNLIAVFIGGASYAMHPFLPFLLCTVQFILAALFISTFPPIAQTESVEKKEGFLGLLQHFPRALSIIWSHKTAFWLVIVNAILIGSIGGTNDFQQLIFTNLGATTVFVGAVYATKRFVSLIMSRLAHRFSKLGLANVMTLCTMLLVGYAFLTPFISSFVLYGAVVLLASIVYSLLEVLFNDALNHMIPSVSRATTLSVANFAQSIVTVAAASLFGWLHLPTPWIFAVLGDVVFIGVIIPLVRLYQTHKQVFV